LFCFCIVLFSWHLFIPLLSEKTKEMLIPKKQRLNVYTYLFKEGVLVAKKDFNSPKHEVIDAPNLVVIKLMQSLKSRGYVKEEFNWGWFYWFLTNEGIEYLRVYLHLTEDVVPATLKKAKSAPRQSGTPQFDRNAREGGREYTSRRGGFSEEKKLGAPSGDFNPAFRAYGRGGGGFRSEGRDSYRRDSPQGGGFGRGMGFNRNSTPTNE